jgi:hypothetical protein
MLSSRALVADRRRSRSRQHARTATIAPDLAARPQAPSPVHRRSIDNRRILTTAAQPFPLTREPLRPTQTAIAPAAPACHHLPRLRAWALLERRPNYVAPAPMPTFKKPAPLRTYRSAATCASAASTRSLVRPNRSQIPVLSAVPDWQPSPKCGAPQLRRSFEQLLRPRSRFL